MNTPTNVANQLMQVLTIICKDDFPENWPSLLNEIADCLHGNNINYTKRVLEAAHILFKQYRYKSAEQNLYEKIKIVSEKIAKPLTAQFTNTIKRLIEANMNDSPTLLVVYDSITLMVKIFYTFSVQDLHEHFENELNVWMEAKLAQMM